MIRTLNIFLRFQSLGHKPGFLFWILARIWNLLRPLVKGNLKSFDAIRFCSENSLDFKKFYLQDSGLVTLDLLFVCASNDFSVLPFSIDSAIKHCLQYQINNIFVVVPENDLDSVTKVLSRFENHVSLISEDTVISEVERKLLRDKFSARYGWAFQQLLKIQMVSKSTSNGVLVVDADTILLHPRNWLDSSDVQLLTPSWELNASYYDHLSSLGISKLKPIHSFVSHHMLMQPKYLREALQFAGWANSSSIVENVTKYRFLSSVSPFSLDYELYAQFMWNNHRDKIRLEKWANAGLPRSSFKEFGNPNGLTIEDFKDFASLSLHSYL